MKDANATGRLRIFSFSTGAGLLDVGFEDAGVFFRQDYRISRISRISRIYRIYWEFG